MENPAAQSLLLHVCCAPCSPHVFRVLNEAHNVSLFFYNPNIQPEKEYKIREAEIIRFAARSGIELILGEYDRGGWNEAVRGHEDEPEGGARCVLCYRYRLERTAREAERLNIGIIATTLSVSPHKNAQLINYEGARAADRAGRRFLEADFKKKDGYRISCELSKEYGFFRQNYCGCVFSRKDRRQ
jgi:predicted adenine nucleotide alpha hydrolase (AANH) superfamily ATPase